MSLLEALIALTVLVGVVLSSTDASIVATQQAIKSELELEATLFAESLVNRIGYDVSPTDREGVSDIRYPALTWSLKTKSIASSLIEVDCQVQIVRRGMVIERSLRTIIPNS
jgi:hypothetical protein